MVQNRFEETLQVSTNLLKLMTGWKLKTPNIFVKWGSYSQPLIWSVLPDCFGFVILCCLNLHFLLIKSAFIVLQSVFYFVDKTILNHQKKSWSKISHFPWWTPHFSRWNPPLVNSPRHRVRRQGRHIQLRHLTGLHWKAGPHLELQRWWSGSWGWTLPNGYYGMLMDIIGIIIWDVNGYYWDNYMGC